MTRPPSPCSIILSALLTRTSTRPKHPVVRSIRRVTSSASLTSAVTATARSGRRSRSCSTGETARSVCRSATTTFATIAVRPLRSISSCSGVVCGASADSIGPRCAFTRGRATALSTDLIRTSPPRFEYPTSAVRRRTGWRARRNGRGRRGAAAARTRRHCGTRTRALAGQRPPGPLRLLRRARQQRPHQRVLQPTHPTPVPGATAPQPAHAAELDPHETARQTMAPTPAPHAPLPRRALRRRDPRQEPSAVVPLAGICAGGRQKWRSLPVRPA